MTQRNKDLPIGVFDSGIGGLTVVKRIIENLPNERIIYFGDTARVPYGQKSNATVIEYALQDAKFLLKKNVKFIVAACNTVSSIAIPDLRRELNVPVIGVIEPGAKMALEKTKSGRIGVIGTRATIGNKAYSKEIISMSQDVEVFEQACPLFVPLAEEGWIDHQATELIASEYLKELKKQNIDVLTLGCTHYPILADVIQSAVGKKVSLIDSGIATAAAVKEELKILDLLSDKEQTEDHEFYVSDIQTKFKEIAELFLGRELSAFHKVDIEDYIDS